MLPTIFRVDQMVAAVVSIKVVATGYVHMLTAASETLVKGHLLAQIVQGSRLLFQYAIMCTGAEIAMQSFHIDNSGEDMLGMSRA